MLDAVITILGIIFLIGLVKAWKEGYLPQYKGWKKRDKDSPFW